MISVITGTADWVADIRGLSTDTKPTSYPNGSTFLEMDTGKVFIFNAQNSTWVEL